MKKYISHSAKQTEEFACALAKELHASDVLAFRGGMGMGKTAFTRGLAKGLGVDEREVSSPTFALVHQYEGADVTLCHFDMYRISGYDDLTSTGFFDYLDAGAILAIEWSENIMPMLPQGTITITLALGPDGEDSREISVEGGDRF